MKTRPRSALIYTMSLCMVLFFILVSMGSSKQVKPSKEFVGIKDGVVSIPDLKLRKAITDKLSFGKNAKISVMDLEKITELEAIEAGIRNLSGIEYCVNLKSLKLTNNRIRNIEPLAELKNLKKLYLAMNEIQDINPLRSLVNIEILELSENGIADISALAKLGNLHTCDLDGNKIEDISVIRGFGKIRVLSLSSNKIKELTPLIKNEAIGSKTEVNVDDNPLTKYAEQTQIKLLKKRGVKIDYMW